METFFAKSRSLSLWMLSAGLNVVTNSRHHICTLKKQWVHYLETHAEHWVGFLDHILEHFSQVFHNVYSEHKEDDFTYRKLSNFEIKITSSRFF